MGGKVAGGIVENQDLERFTANFGDVAPKDQIDLMARNWFSLTPGRTQPIEHEYIDSKSGLTETVRVTGSADQGIATLFDADILIFAISQWIEAQRQGFAPSRRVHFTPYQLFAWLNISPTGTAYARLKDALHRLKMTSIETTVKTENGKRSRNRIRQFSWISEWEIAEENGEVRGVEVVLAEWLFESIRGFHVLTLDRRYFSIQGTVERWLYLYARKSTGGAHGIWKESFKNLYNKSASQQQYKHFASALRKIVKKDNLPGLRLETVSSLKGKDMLRMERTEKRVIHETKALPAPEAQLNLIERSPLEETWENVLEVMRRRVGPDIVKAWLEKLQLLSIENGTATFRAPTKFVAEWVEAHMKQKLEAAWQSFDEPIKSLRFEIKGAKKAS